MKFGPPSDIERAAFRHGFDAAWKALEADEHPDAPALQAKHLAAVERGWSPSTKRQGDLLQDLKAA